jgi:hypothetical protein
MTERRARDLSQASRITGPGAAALKYDILTALLVTAAQGDPVSARLSLRLSLLITARFNWRRGTFAVGQKEMARMWGVTERTAKREMAEMRARGWIAVDVPAARGRVASYRIALTEVLHATMPHWDAVGPDFAARMVGAPEAETEPSNVIPLRRAAEAMPAAEGSVWGAAADRLRAQDSDLYTAWFAQLEMIDLSTGTLTLMAPSRFIADYVATHYRSRLLAALAVEDRSIREVRITHPG